MSSSTVQTGKTTQTANTASQHSMEAIFYMVLLAFQFGLQPSLTRRFTPPTVCRSTVVLCQELLKFALAFLMLTLSGKRTLAFHGKVHLSSCHTSNNSKIF